jgi:hypothetical protein
VIWFWLYIAAMFLVALPVAWFTRNEVAGIVFAVWGVGQVTYQIGFPEPQTQILLYAGAFVFLLIRRLRHQLNVPDGSLVAMALFVPLLLVCVLWAAGATPLHDAWWGIWFLAMTQVTFLVRPLTWFRGARRWLTSKSTVDRGGNFMVRA